LFDPSSDLIRMPAETFWVEMLQEAEREGGQPDGGRIGVLVHTEQDGRSGFIRHFMSRPDGICSEFPAWTEFDFNKPPPRAANSYGFEHLELPHLAGLFAHARLHLDTAPTATGTRVPQIEPATLASKIAKAVWFDLPLLVSFAALLNSPGIVGTRPSDLQRLNRARARRDRLPLLDHVEVQLVLGRQYDRGVEGGGHRATPRLHYVRGHLVRRGEKTFWRSAHLRGDTGRAIVQKTVRVTAAAALRR
jgi:hypothetical protein